MPCTKIYLLPVGLFLWFIISFLVTYIVALCYKHIYPYWPYISDNGVYAPERCIFGQLFHIGCCLMAATVYTRYIVLKKVCEIYVLNIYIKYSNIATLWIGLLATFGVSIVGNFQEKKCWQMHFIGASIAYILGTLYQFSQILLTIIIYPNIGSKLIIVTRICISTVYCVTLGTCIAFGTISLEQFDGDQVTEWTPEHSGYIYHIISSISEWIMTTLVLCFLLTYTHEFKNVIVYKPKVEVSEGEVR